MTCLLSPTSEAQELAGLGLTGKWLRNLWVHFALRLKYHWTNRVNIGLASPWWFKPKDKNVLKKKHADITTFLLESLLTNFNDCFGLILIVIGYQL